MTHKPRGDGAYYLRQPQVSPFIATLVALGVIDFFIYRIFHSSRAEACRLILLLTDIYTDHWLGKYFDQLREEFYVERYSIRFVLCRCCSGWHFCPAWRVAPS